MVLLNFVCMRGSVTRGPPGDDGEERKAALDALPPAILMAVIAPTILTTGLAESSAAVLTAAVAFMRAPLVVTILTGVISVVLLRMFLG